jgi:16S rRNA (guanine527-N7)-methyltransferase
MLTEDQIAALEAAWAQARTTGVLGSATVKDLWEHTAGFTSAVCSAFSADAESLAVDLVDVGTGAGVPGLLLALQLPRARVTLLDANDRRLDHVRRARRALDLEARTQVIHRRAEDFAHDPQVRGRFDVAVARLLADPGDALELLAPLVGADGVVVLSTSMEAAGRLEALPVPGLPLGPATRMGGTEAFVVTRRAGEMPPELPRREKARRRAPLLPR